jgi:hypothetical protein
MRFSLQDMVRNTLAEAAEREKLASAPESEKQGPPASKKEEKKDKAEDKAEKKEEAVKTSSVFVEKLASAVDWLNSYYLPKLAAGEIGPGTGPNPLPLNSATAGHQNYETGQASHDQPPKTPGKDPKSPGQTNPGTALETTINDPPGGHESWKGKDVMKQAQIARVAAIMAKMAGEDTAHAHLGGAHHDNPPPATKAEEGVPSLPGPAARQESMINSNQAAIHYTKGQAKAEPKRRMSEVLSEPAQKKSTDPVLHNNFDATGKAGVKIAAARVLLQKIAEEGAKPDSGPEAKEMAGKLQQLMKKHKQHESGESAEDEKKEHAEGHEKASGIGDQDAAPAQEGPGAGASLGGGF